MKKQIIYIAEDDKSAQYRYRIKNVAEALEISNKYEVVWFLKSEIAKAYDALSDTALVVIERQTAKDNIIPDFMKAVKARGIKVLFDVDDLIFDFKDLPLLMRSTNSKNIFYWTGYFWGIRRVAKLADGFITTNDFLGKKLTRTFKKQYGVIVNSLNNEQVKKSEALIRDKKISGFKLGYFSGSPTHAKDFRMIEPELIRFLGDYKDAVLNIVGYMEFSDEMKKLIEKGRVKVKKPVPYDELLKEEANVNVNLAPLVVNDFTNCKSELKYFEAAVVETTTIASLSYSYREAMTNGENGLLAKPGEWYDKIKYLYENPDRNRKFAVAARKNVLDNYYGAKLTKQIEEVYDYFIG